MEFKKMHLLHFASMHTRMKMRAASKPVRLSILYKPVSTHYDILLDYKSFSYYVNVYVNFDVPLKTICGGQWCSGLGSRSVYLRERM